MPDREDIFSEEKENSRIDSADTIKSSINDDLKENFNVDKDKIKKQLEAAKNVEERVKLFSKLTDAYWLEAFLWLIPAIWDLTPAIISTIYLIAEWIHIWLSRQDSLKILWYQALDLLVWAVPLIWNIADFFFKGNKYSAKVFSDHYEKLKKIAFEKGVSQEEIDNMWKKEQRFVKLMDKYVDYKSKKKKKSKK